jgi:hypothetical protein
MKLSKQLKQIAEGVHYNTKIRSLDEKAGIRRIRMGMRESARLIANILNPNHPTPNPASQKDGEVLEKCREALTKLSEELGSVRTSRRIKEGSNK